MKESKAAMASGEKHASSFLLVCFNDLNIFLCICFSLKRLLGKPEYKIKKRLNVWRITTAPSAAELLPWHLIVLALRKTLVDIPLSFSNHVHTTWPSFSR